jgi:SAM-dependent methyltransferase
MRWRRAESSIPERAKDLYYRESRRSFEDRWDEVRRMADFRRTDRVLDVGCAEGLITLEVANMVDQVHGIDVHESRIGEATRLAAQRGVGNATFEVASIIDYPLEPRSYDVSLVMAVWGKPTPEGDRRVGADELRRILEATRRQMVMRVNVQHRAKRELLLEQILDLCEQADFDALCFSRPMLRKGEPGGSGANLLIANRRGADARTGQLPRLALIPTARLLDHPVVGSSASPQSDRATVDRT